MLMNMHIFLCILFACSGASLSRAQACGVDRASLTPREGITQFKQFPFLGYINYGDANSHQSYSKAVLISTRYALTTAINISPKFLKPWSVTFGDHCDKYTLQCFLGSSSNSFFSQERSCTCPNSAVTIEVKSTHPHPDHDFVNDRYTNDIGLVELKYSIILTEYIQTICLPLREINMRDGDQCYFCTHGDTTNSEGTSYRISKRKTVIVPVRNFNQCAAKYMMKGIKLDRDGVLCAGDSDGDNCPSDSGAPLMMRDYGRWTVVAILSFGSKACSSADKPSVYTKIYKYSNWIKSVINS